MIMISPIVLFEGYLVAHPILSSIVLGKADKADNDDFLECDRSPLILQK